MARSTVRVVGRLALPEGASWGEAISMPRWRQVAVLELQAIAARAFGLSASRVRVHQQLWTGPSLGRLEPEQRWHRDACSEKGHVLCTGGSPPTEFLLGEYPDGYLVEPADFSPLESVLERWVPDPGTAVHVDRLTIHRRPACGLEPRLLLVASKAPEAGEVDEYARQAARDLRRG